MSFVQFGQRNEAFPPKARPTTAKDSAGSFPGHLKSRTKVRIRTRSGERSSFRWIGLVFGGIFLAKRRDKMDWFKITDDQIKSLSLDQAIQAWNILHCVFSQSLESARKSVMARMRNISSSLVLPRNLQDFVDSLSENSSDEEICEASRIEKSIDSLPLKFLFVRSVLLKTKQEENLRECLTDLIVGLEKQVCEDAYRNDTSLCFFKENRKEIHELALRIQKTKIMSIDKDELAKASDSIKKVRSLYDENPNCIVQYFEG